MKKIKKPTGACAKALSSLFPSAERTQLQRTEIFEQKPFDPLKDCVALDAQRKKKKAMTRSKNVAVTCIVLPIKHNLIMPKGKIRDSLARQGRIQIVRLKRVMTPAQVRNSIFQTFRHINLSCWIYLGLEGSKLKPNTSQNPGGEIVDRRGALYILESKAIDVGFNYFVGMFV